MTLQVSQNQYESGAKAQEAFQQAGLHVMNFEVPPVSNTAHWHHFNSEFFIERGHLTLTDVGNSKVMECRPGSWVRVPARVLHAEASEKGYTIILGTSVPPDQFGDPVDRDPETL